MGLAHDHFLELKPEIDLVTEDRFLIQNGTTEQVTAFGDRVAELVDRKGSLIIDEGARPECVNTLRKRLNAFIVAELKTRQAIESGVTKEELWRDRKAEAKAIRGRLFAYGDAMFEEGTPQREKFEEVTMGQGNDDFVHDMFDITTLIRENEEFLAAFPKFDRFWLDRGEELFHELRDIRAMIDHPDETMAALMKTERQAYAYLEEALGEIVKYGKLAFFDDQESRDILVREYVAKNLAEGIKKKQEELENNQ